MKKYITDFIKDLERNLQENHSFTKEEISLIRIKIMDFQHERLIHLLVTLFYGVFSLFLLLMSKDHVIFLLPFLFEIIFLLFYIKHYFFLENSVQYIYTLFDKIIKSQKKK